MQSHPRQSKTSQKFRYPNLIKVIAHEEAKTQVASLKKELFEIAHLKTLTTKCQGIFSYLYWIKFKCKVLFLYSFEYICLFKSLGKKTKNPPETLRLSVIAFIGRYHSFKVGTEAIFCRRGYFKLHQNLRTVMLYTGKRKWIKFFIFLWWITVCLANINLDEEQGWFARLLSLSKIPLSFACILDGHVFNHVRTTLYTGLSKW